MAVPPRSAVSGFPIRVFIEIPSADTLDAINAFINDMNKYLGGFFFGLPQLTFSLATLPVTAAEGTSAWIADGKKIGETTGTGIYAYFSHGSWRTVSTDAPIPAPGFILTEAGGHILTEDGGRILR